MTEKNLPRGKILFVVNGMGLGNSTRAFAIIEELNQLGHEVDVATFGNGELFFRDRPEIRLVKSLAHVGYWSAGRQLLWYSPLLSIGMFVLGGIKNIFTLRKLMKENQYRCVVLNSSYNLIFTVAPCPVVSINNANQILRNFFRLGGLPLPTWPQLLVEIGDYFFQLIIPDQVISAWFARRQSTTPAAHFFSVDPIVRESFRPTIPLDQKIKNIAVIYSGSNLGEEMHEQLASSLYTVNVIGRAGLSRTGMHFHQGLKDTSAILKTSDLVVTNGGYSSLAEGLAMHKPLLVFPVRNHAEQLINAKRVVELGVGEYCDSTNFIETFKAMLPRISAYQSGYEKMDMKAGGAQQAARIILSRSQQKAAPRLKSSSLIWQSLLVACAFFLSFFWYREFSSLTIFQARDLARAQLLISGHPILFGPEMSGGGHLPGSFYYVLLSIPYALGQGLNGAWILMLLLAAAAAGISWAFIAWSCGFFPALLVTATLFSSASIQSGLWSFQNPSFGFYFIVLSLIGLCMTYAREQSRGRCWLVTCLVIGLGTQLHLTIALLFCAGVLLQLFSRKLKLNPIKWQEFFLGVLVYFSCTAPYLMWRLILSPDSRFFQRPLVNVGSAAEGPRFLLNATFKSFGDFVRSSAIENPGKVLTTLVNSFPDKLILLLVAAYMGIRLVSPKGRAYSTPLQRKSANVLGICLAIAALPPLLSLSPTNFFKYGHCFFFCFALFIGFIFSPLSAGNIRHRNVAQIGFLTLATSIFFSWRTIDSNVLLSWLTGAALVLALFTLHPIPKRWAWLSAWIILFPLCLALRQPSAKVLTVFTYPTLQEQRDLSEKIISLTGWDFQTARNRVFFVNYHFESTLSEVYQSVFFQSKLTPKQPKMSGFFAAMSQSPLHPATDQRKWLLQQGLEPSLTEAINNGELIVDTPLAISTRLGLFPYRVLSSKNIPEFFQNHGQPYANSQSDLVATISDAKKRPAHQAAVASFSECELHQPFCQFAIIAQSEDFRDPRHKISVTILGEPLSQPSAWINPSWTESIRQPYMELACKGGAISRVVLADSVGYRRVYARPDQLANGVNPHFLRLVLNHTFLAPFQRNFFPDCAGATKIKLGFASAEASVHGILGNVLPGESQSFRIPPLTGQRLNHP